MINYIKHARFNWDHNNYQKCQKHGVSIKEIENLFKSDELYLTPDFKHSKQEQRFLAIGVSITNKKGIFVAFTLRTKEDSFFIRPISARYMHKKEQQKYEEPYKIR